ncbi:MAG: hypothetical protein HYZ34_08455 [Ignavibacteriae bacterium]|nr:hypothetical protein [Ignavibacteriota bacterium]
MMDPLTIEQNLQTLKQTLPLLSSKRMKLLEILEFLEPLSSENSLHFLSAYLPELMPEITTSILQTDFTGTNPDFIQLLKKILASPSGLLIQNNENDELLKAIEHLKQEEAKFASWQNQQTNGLFSTTKSKSFATDKVWIPMVEREPILTELVSKFATLSQLRIDVSFSPKPIQEDELHVTQFADTNKNNPQELRSALVAAKDFFERVTHIKIKKKLIVRCTFEHANLIIGESLCAGLAAVIFTELLRLHQHKEEFSIRPDVAITGALDSSGKLIPVDEHGLSLKMEACMFSPIRFLVVPKKQEKLCVDELKVISVPQSGMMPKAFKKLKEVDEYVSTKYKEPSTNNYEQSTDNPEPTTVNNELIQINLSLEVVGIENFSELFFDRRLTDSRRIPLAKQAGRKLWKHRLPIAATTIVILLLVIGRMWYGPLDKNPAIAKYEGEFIVVKNINGETLEKIWVGKYTAKDPDGFMVNRNVCFYDIDSDNVNEIFWFQLDNDRTDHTSCINAKKLGEENLLWTFPVRKKLYFPGNTDKYADKFNSVVQLKVGDFDNDDRPEIYLLAKNQYFGCVLFKLNAVTKNELGYYIHAGHLQTFDITDLDNDGVQEIILTGYNNSFGDAPITVLDSRLIEGHSPCTQLHKPQDIQKGIERYYLLMPRTIVANQYKNLVDYSHSFLESIDSHDKFFRVSISEVHLFNIPDREMAGYSLIFDFSLRASGMPKSNTFYDVMVDYFVSEGVFPERSDTSFWDRQWRKHLQSIQYWDGTQFVNHPTVNKRWLQALKERGLPIPPGIPDSLIQ